MGEALGRRILTIHKGGETTGINDSLSEAAKRARREYKREWNRRNRDKVKEAQKKYWERKARQESEVNKDECGETEKIHNGGDPAVSEH